MRFMIRTSCQNGSYAFVTAETILDEISGPGDHGKDRQEGIIAYQDTMLNYAAINGDLSKA
jgi:hypothetical protein